ncbi:MAG: DUF1499 domain-containing protein [Alphaproteobacteria bacterium]|nr:DUF1499 domain-containing protein [Alphaproteobacteria bacterium]
MVTRPAALARLAVAAGLLLPLAGCGAEPQVDDLRNLVRPGSPNNYLICRSGLCAATADEDGPFYDLAPERLLETVRRVAAAQPNTVAAGEDAALSQLVFVQRTRWLRFPDMIRVQTIKTPDGRTALALYSQSVYGYYDFGVNKTRVRTWLQAIKAELGK